MASSEGNLMVTLLSKSANPSGSCLSRSFNLSKCGDFFSRPKLSVGRVVCFGEQEDFLTMFGD